MSSISSCHWDDLTARTWPYPHCVVVSRAREPNPMIVMQARQACGLATDAPLTSRQLAEGILRLLLAPLCQQDASALCFARNQYGKPFLPQYPAIQFNLSHTHSAFAFAFARYSQVGVDVERCQGQVDRKRAVAKRFFHPDEIRWLESLDDMQFLSAFTRLWSRKEAYIKALGMGLHKSLESFSCLTDHQGALQVVDSGSVVTCRLSEEWVEGEPAVALSCCLLPNASTDADTWRLLLLQDETVQDETPQDEATTR
ncbi:4'-phosphopantetheinyl transferase superfamily protein [Dickeya oryzae]|uniref:4'-phosphopantetheinyl transferase superfamily protein n=1 Tax=Dickeya oryzae TaxID=1240404 RepID=A0AB39ITD6_9GAMM|nr:4'-phosphopantetheinyl transferase superfamily protein [Dickeya oryzae]MCA6992006.1 4'-phosphopantetheinyl transferase superfamily protein [Dickeya oryzae]